MFSLTVEMEDLFNEFPFVETKWLSHLRNMPDVVIKDSKLEFYYTYGYYLPKSKDESLIEVYNNILRLKYDDRLKYELGKVRVSLTIKHGHLLYTNRLPKKQIPDIIKEIVTELTKVKMNLEYEYHKDDSILETVPKINTSLVSIEVLKDELTDDFVKIEKGIENYITYEIDDILDKINESGIDSLTDGEKNFLNNLNKR
jgi:hypothetical protein